MAKPFAFIKEKPPYQKLWDAITETITSPIGPNTVSDIQMMVFLYVSINNAFNFTKEHIHNSLSLSEIEVIQKTTGFSTVRRNLLQKYSDLLPNPDNIPVDLLVGFMSMVDMPYEKYLRTFDRDGTDIPSTEFTVRPAEEISTVSAYTWNIVEIILHQDILFTSKFVTIPRDLGKVFYIPSREELERDIITRAIKRDALPTYALAKPYTPPTPDEDGGIEHHATEEVPF